MNEGEPGEGVTLGFERESVVVPVAQIVPLKVLRPGTKESRKYAQILTSVRAVGLVEAPVVAPDRKRRISTKSLTCLGLSIFYGGVFGLKDSFSGLW